MMRALSTAGTGMMAQQHNLDTIANNLANVNTTGFKQQRAEFQDLMYETFRSAGSATGRTFTAPISLQIGMGTSFTATAPNMSQGSPIQTSNPTDMMITGNGFFQVQRPDGSLSYTRDGSFRRDATGNLVTTDGYPVEPAVNIPADASNVSISADGRVTGIKGTNPESVEFGTVKVFVFTNPAGLDRVGGNLYRQTSASGNAESKTPGAEGAGMIRGGYVESSNVQVVEEMVKMITAQRAYEINSKAITTADEMLNTVNALKR